MKQRRVEWSAMLWHSCTVAVESKWKAYKIRTETHNMIYWGRSEMEEEGKMRKRPKWSSI